MIFRRAFLFIASSAAICASLGAQSGRSDTTRAADQALRVYLDCQTMGCDRDFFVTEIAFVNWTRDRADADIHVLITSLETGSGGLQYSSQFIGQKRFASHADTIVTSLPPSRPNTIPSTTREISRPCGSLPENVKVTTSPGSSSWIAPSGSQCNRYAASDSKQETVIV